MMATLGGGWPASRPIPLNNQWGNAMNKDQVKDQHVVGDAKKLVKDATHKP